ncbi:MAG: hypothetical protein IPO32_03750 [Crocinitomicaceae bacterium]|nr:hypothetical protein [Crocinitomicaceae bacterium]
MDNYSIHFSPDLNKIGILQPSKNKVRIAVIDENMNKSNPVEFAMDFVVNNADLRNAVISDSGDVCLVASGDQEEDDVSLPNKYLIVFRQDGEELIYNLQLDPGKSILSCGIDFRDHQTLTCSGFYCEDSTTLVRGAFNITYHLGQQEILSKQSYAISNPAYTDYQTLINEASKFETEKKRIKYLEKIASGNYGMGNEINTRSIPCSDGGTIILGEEFDFRNTIEYPTANIEGIGDMPEFYSYWVLKRIFVLKFGPEGNLQWQNIIDRKKFIGPPITNLNTIHFNDIYAYNEKSGKFYFVYDENENRKVNSTRLIIFNLANGNYIETELFSSKINGFNQFNFPVKFTTDVAEKGLFLFHPITLKRL